MNAQPADWFRCLRARPRARYYIEWAWLWETRNFAASRSQAQGPLLQAMSQAQYLDQATNQHKVAPREPDGRSYDQPIRLLDSQAIR